MKLKNGMKVIAPSGCESYLTKYKEYEVFNVGLSHNEECEFNFNFIDDKGKTNYSILKGSAHLNGQDWIIKNETNMKLSEKLLKEIYNSLDAELKTKIEIEVPEIKPIKFQKGKWYIQAETRSIIFCESFSGNTITGYGFSMYGDWQTHYHIMDAELATPEEVETALIAEAKRRGFKEGITIASEGINGWMQCKFEPFSGLFTYRKDLNILECKDGNGHIFQNGQWATIITEPTQKEILQKQVAELKRQIDSL